MLDTRALRDRQAATTDVEALADSGRLILGAAQEAWLFDRLRRSQRAGTGWRVLDQQVMFSRVVQPGRPVGSGLMPRLLPHAQISCGDGSPAACRRLTTLIAPLSCVARRSVARNFRSAVFVAWYNFCRVHQALRVTPAMEAGLTNHIWSLHELLIAA